MERIFVFVVVFVFLIGGVFSADSWEDVSSNGSDVVEEEVVAEDYVAPSYNDEGAVSSGEPDKFFTANFYIAMALIVLALALIIYVIWLVLLGPRNEWEK